MSKTVNHGEVIPASLTKWKNLWCKRRPTKAIQANQTQTVTDIGYLRLCINATNQRQYNNKPDEAEILTRSSKSS